MKVKIIAIFLIMLLIPVFFFVDETQAVNEEWRPFTSEIINISINRGTGGILSSAVYKFSVKTLDNYNWVVNNTEYVFSTSLINKDDVTNGVLTSNNYSVHIMDGILPEQFYSAFPTGYYLKDIFNDYIYIDSGGFIGRCGGALFPLGFDGSPDTLSEWGIEKDAFIDEDMIKTDVRIKTGIKVVSEWLTVYGKRLDLMIILPRLPRNPHGVGIGAYSYSINGSNDSHHWGVCTNLTDLNKEHPILSDYHGDSLFTRCMGGGAFSIVEGEGVVSLAEYPEDCYETKTSSEVTIWKFRPVMGKIWYWCKFLINLVKECLGMVSIDDLPHEWQDLFEGQEEVSWKDLVEKITATWYDWTPTNKKAVTRLPGNPAIIAFRYGKGRVVLSGPHTASTIWDGGHIVDNDDTNSNSLAEGLYCWKDDNNVTITNSDLRNNTDLQWYQRREVAWASGRVNDSHLPPVYNRSHVIDIDPVLQDSEFTIECCVAKENGSDWEWHDVNLSLCYRYNGSDSNYQWTNWKPYDSITTGPYFFRFNATECNGTGWYEFYSILNTTNASGYECDEAPPVADAKALVGGPVYADFTYDPLTPFDTDTITFNGSKSMTVDGTYIDQYFWDFGDGQNESGQEGYSVVNHGYQDNGTYMVSLTVTNNQSSSANCSKTILVRNVAPQADFTPRFTVVFVNQTVNFTDLSSDVDGNITGWFWDFGDGINATEQNSSHSYSEGDLFKVTLNVTDNDDATDKATGFVWVINALVNQSQSEQNNTWNTIQDAVDNASTGDIIYVHNGTYTENITINKSLSLIGENRTTVVVNGSVVMVNPRDYELPSNDTFDLRIVVNMTGNVLLMHFNNDSEVGENYSFSDLVYDYSGQNNNGTRYGATWNDTSLKGRGCFDFDGVDDSINLSSISALVGENVTVSAWIDWAGGSGTADTILSQSNSTHGYCLYVNNTNSTPTFRLNDTKVASSVNISSGWHSVVGTHNKTTLKIYVDGKLTGSQTKLGTGINKGCFIGFDNNSNYFNGTIDEIAVWNRTLSDDEILNLYDANYGVNIEGLTIRNSDVGVKVCNHSEIFDCLIINHNIGVSMSNSSDVRLSLCDITECEIGVNITSSNPEIYYFNRIVDCEIDNTTNAIFVNSSSNIYFIRDIVNGSNTNLSFSNCNFSYISVMDCSSPANVAPDKPSLRGEIEGSKDGVYWYNSTTNDSNDDQMLYLFDWGDGNTTGWLGLFESNETVNASHTFENEGGYFIQVKAKDVFDNVSTWSEYILFRTETTPPSINSVNNSPSFVGFGFNITFTTNVTDGDSGVESVTVNITYPDSSTGNYTMNNTVNDTYEYVFSDTWLVGQYNYTIWAMDNAYNINSSSGHSFNVSAEVTISVCTIKDEYGNNETINLTDPPGDPPLIGYELLDDGDVLHMWNEYNSYYFNTSSGIQLTNHYDEYWSHNVLMLGYYNNDEWNLIYRTDELSGFNKNVSTDNETFVNATLWKNLTYGGYDFRLAIRYHLGVNDSDLTVIPYIKNLGQAIPYTLAFGWEIKDIKIADTYENDWIRLYNGTDWISYSLNQTLNNTYADMDYNTTFYLEGRNEGKYLRRTLYLRWNHTLDYLVRVKSRTGQYNAPVTLFIKVGTLSQNQEKYTEMHWLDSDDWLGISSSEHDSCCGNCVGEGPTLENALDGTFYWQHDETETHWFIIDLGQRYIIKKVRGQSDTYKDPTDVNIYVSDSKTSWGTAVATGISTWQDTPIWQEIDTTDKNGRYIKVEIETTEDSKFNYIEFGRYSPEFVTIFDAYGDIVNQTPEISNPSPVDGSTGISTSPMLNITVADPNADSMNISWYSNSSGSWQVFGTNNSVSNGTYHQTFTNASTNAQWWYWKVNVTDGTNYAESSVYKFYTGYQSKINNTGSTSIKGYLLIQVQYYNTSTSTWVVADDTVNETSPRTINWDDPFGPGGQGILALDTIFNGLVNTSNLSSFGNGTYRIYAAFRDPDGNVLVTDDETELVATYEFDITFD